MYLTMFVALRVSGRRTLAQFSAFDFVVTIAMGSLLAATALSPGPSYGRGAVALVVLILMQLVIAWTRQRVAWTRKVLDFRPVEIIRNGRMELTSSPFGPQLTADEVRSMLRQKGVFDVENVRQVILEPDGKISVLRDPAAASSDED